ncbi:MAG: hypothetical protein PHH77_05500 [Victivallaceae bacterium]|nr:hypothetical protein [Victivallaceae bacterium]
MNLLDPKIWQSPECVGLNRLPARATLFNFSDEISARKVRREFSPWVADLNGVWKFRYTTCPGELTADCVDPAAADASWDDIAVPGCFNLQGYGKPHYTNIVMPWDNLPPTVPDENPTGIYRRRFRLDASWQNRRTILHFDGVESFFRVYVNGQDAGYSKGSRTATEFDLTPFLHDGDNLLAVIVVRWSDASFLEDQDHWWTAGICRNVYLRSRPRNAIADVFAVATLDDDYRDGLLKIKFHGCLAAPPENWKYQCRLYAPDGQAVFFFCGSGGSRCQRRR